MGQPINLLNESAPDKSVDQNSATLINWYAQLDVMQDGNTYTSGLYPTPGLTLFSTINTPVRALYEEHNITYAVGGNTFYSIASNGTATSHGTLNTSTGFAKIKGIFNEIMIIDGTNGYIYNISGNTFTQISDVNFTNNCTDLNSQDEFFMVQEPNSQTWQISAISDGLTWTVLGLPQFASVSGNENNLVGFTSLQRQIWLFSEDTTEVWYNAGATGFPFARNTSVYIEWGCAAKQSIAYGDNTLWCLGKSRTGGYAFIGMNGYTPEVISTPAINYQISTYAVVSDCIGFCYQQEGHEFAVWTFPTQGITWAYDFTTKRWGQRQSLISGIQTRWIANCYAFCYNKQLVGDYQSGNVYQLDMTNNTENGALITRTLISSPLYQSGAIISIPRLQLDVDQTAGAALSNYNLYISRDGGNTFGSAKPAIPQQNRFGQWHIYYTRLGAANKFGIKISITANIKAIILGVWANLSGQGQ